MNQGMPNSSALAASALTAALGVTGFWAILLKKVLEFLFEKASKTALIYADKAHVAILVNHEGKEFDEAEDTAWEVIDSGVPLSQEQKDAIDKPVMDAFRKLATFRVRNP